MLSSDLHTHVIAHTHRKINCKKESPVIVYFTKSDEAGGMAQWMKTFVIKIFDLSLILETHMVEEENQTPKVTV